MTHRLELDTLLPAVEGLRRSVEAVALPLEVEGAQQARREQAALIDQLDDYVLPRLRSLDAPLLAVVGGSTGAGKSTLVNSVLREAVTRSGVLRPTTRSPVKPSPKSTTPFPTPPPKPSTPPTLSGTLKSAAMP